MESGHTGDQNAEYVERARELNAELETALVAHLDEASISNLDIDAVTRPLPPFESDMAGYKGAGRDDVPDDGKRTSRAS